jgi:uncharacterized membrane protein
MATLIDSFKQDLSIPPGWNYNPSIWKRRQPIVIAAGVGFFIATYMGLYQINVIPVVWEPFFGRGSHEVLTSDISYALPIPDSILGAIVYLIDVVTGSVGGSDRWRTKPWIVFAFGIAIGPLGLTSLVLVILQPVAVGAWCTLCLFTALISIMMIGPAMDEVLASLQLMKRAKREGVSLWDVFWGKSTGYKVLV